jgi:hypothetical protein
MTQQDYDKVIKLIENILEIQVDVKTDLEDGKISLLEAVNLTLKHAGKAVFVVSNIKELGLELADTDEQEAEQATEVIANHFGGSPEAVEATKDITGGIASVSQGIQKLLALKK